MRQARSQFADSQRRERTNLWLFTGLVIFIFAIDWLGGGFIRTTVRSIAGSVAVANVSIIHAISSSGLFASKAELASENAALQRQLNDAQARAAAYDVVRAENDQLRSLIGMASSSKGTLVPIISTTQHIPYGTFLVSLSDVAHPEGTSSPQQAVESAHATSGSLVISQSGFVIGKLISTGDDTGLVRELFSPGASISGIVGDSTFTLEGRGEGNARGRLPRAAKVSVGDEVTSTEVAGKTIGHVGQVVADAGGSFQDVYIDQGVNFSTLENVFLVSK